MHPAPFRYRTQIALAVKLSTALLIAALLAAVEANAGSLITEISQLAAEGKHAQILRNLQDEPWSQRSDPRLLIVFCRAQFKINAKAPSCAVATSDPSVQLFAKALWWLCTGELSRATAAFEYLRSDSELQNWGALGLLELAAYVEDLPALKQHIADLRDRDLSDLQASAWLYEYEERADILENGLTSAALRIDSPRSVAVEIDTFDARCRILLAQKNFDAARNMMSVSQRQLHNTVSYRMCEAEYALATGNKNEYCTILKRATVEYPSDASLIIDYLISEFDLCGPSTDDQITSDIYRVCTLRSADAKFLLEVSVTLAAYGRIQAVRSVLGIYDKNASQMQGFALHAVLGAWLKVDTNKLFEAQADLLSALQRSPSNIHANWLQLLVAMRLEDYGRAVGAALILHREDPLNENVSALIDKLSRKSDDRRIQELKKDEKYGPPK